jgi:hypothetical protein
VQPRPSPSPSPPPAHLCSWSCTPLTSANTHRSCSPRVRLSVCSVCPSRVTSLPLPTSRACRTCQHLRAPVWGVSNTCSHASRRVVVLQCCRSLPRYASPTSTSTRLTPHAVHPTAPSHPIPSRISTPPVSSITPLALTSIYSIACNASSSMPPPSLCRDRTLYADPTLTCPRSAQPGSAL